MTEAHERRVRRTGIALVLAAAAIAGCGTQVEIVHRPPALGPPRDEAAQQQPLAPHGRHVPLTAATGCGIERWAVKTATDPGASQINPTPQDTTIAQLDSIAAPIQPTDRVAPIETTTYRIQATITAVKQEADGDYHLALSDGQGDTMIAESPSPSCDQGSVLASQIQTVRNTLNAACPNIGPSYENVNIPATLTGVGFFDRIHGQLAVAPNGIELHPLTDIALNGHC